MSNNNPYGSINYQQSSDNNNVPSAYQNSFPSVPSSVPNNNNIPSYATTTGSTPINQNIPAYASMNPSNASNQNMNNTPNNMAANTPSYATLKNNNQHTQSPTTTIPIYASINQFPSVPQTNPTPNQSFQTNYNNKQVNNKPTIDPNTPSYISGVYPTKTEASSPYTSDNKIKKFDSLSDLYASSKQSSYINNQQASAKIASESLRKSVQKENSVILNDDGSIEGWLWQQSKSGSWDRLYFILDHDKLLGFAHYPQKDEFVSPIHALPLKTGMLVSILQVSYLGVNGNCFAVQIKPNSSNVVMFDSLTKDDRETWVNYLEKATKADQVSAWIPWEMENKQALLQKEQELLQEQQREEQRLNYEKEKKIQEQLELVRKQELAKLENSNIAGYIQTSYNQENNIKNIEQAENRLRDETKELSVYKEQCQSSNDSTEAIDASIKERESKLQELEKQKHMTNDSSNNLIPEKSLELEIERIKKEQQEILKKEEERIRAELTAQFEKETQLLRKQQEEKLKLERQEQKRKAKDQEIAQVRKWLQENQSWAEYYKNLGVTEEELQDPACLKLIKKLIKDTAQYVIKSGISNNESTPIVPSTPSDTPDTPIVPSTPDISTIPNILDNTSDTSSQVENINQDTNISSDNTSFESLLPARPPPPPPSDDDKEDNIIQDNIPSPPNNPIEPPIPQENINNTIEQSNIKVSESPEITNSNAIPSPPTNIPPPPSIPPPPPIPTAPILNIKRTNKQNIKTNETKQSDESMMDSITNFKFAEKKQGDKVQQRTNPPLKKEESMLDEIRNFKFSERKSVPTITQLPKQKQDSLTALLSDQLTIFRSKLREDQLDDDDDEDDDYWD